MTALRAVPRPVRMITVYSVGEALAHKEKRPIRTIAPMGMNRCVSPDSAWPLRAADGRTFAERKER